MSNFKQLREETGLSIFHLAVESGVSPASIDRMEKGKRPVSRRIVFSVLRVLSKRLEREIEVEDVEGLQVSE